MVATEPMPERGAAEPHRTEAEDAALALSLVIIGVLGLTLVSLLVLEFLEILPGGIDRIAFLSLIVFALVVGKALLSRLLSTPTLYRGHTPTVRPRSR